MDIHWFFKYSIYLKRFSKAIHQPLVIFSWRKSAASNSFMTAFGKNPSHPWDSYIFTYIKTININQKCRYDIYHTCILWVIVFVRSLLLKSIIAKRYLFGVNTQFEIYNPPIFFHMGWDSTNLSLTTFPAPWEKFRRRKVRSIPLWRKSWGWEDASDGLGLPVGMDPFHSWLKFMAEKNGGYFQTTYLKWDEDLQVRVIFAPPKNLDKIGWFFTGPQSWKEKKYIPTIHWLQYKVSVSGSVDARVPIKFSLESW